MPINLDFLEGASLLTTESISRSSNYDLKKLSHFALRKIIQQD